MDDYKIVPLGKNHISDAKDLVNTVFPSQSPIEKVKLRLFENNKRLFVRFLLVLLGMELINYWIALSGQNKVLAISGLYRRRKDKNEALWLGWFAVHPEARGRNIGGAMLKYAISQAESLGASFLRLYTTDSERIKGAADAQKVYEHYGFSIKSSRKVFGGLIINTGGINILKENYIVREKPL